MRPFRFFFGLTIAIILFFFVARILVIAFIAAAVLSIIYAIMKRISAFIRQSDHEDKYGYPRFGESSFNRRSDNRIKEEIEPLFYGEYPKPNNPIRKIQLVEAF